MAKNEGLSILDRNRRRWGDRWGDRWGTLQRARTGSERLESGGRENREEILRIPEIYSSNQEELRRELSQVWQMEGKE